jgi:LPS O-antigen subunit length determinant protein (WzzB/FepE family)
VSSTPKSFQVTEPADKRHSRIEYAMNPALLTLLRASKYIAALSIVAFVIAALLAKFVMVKLYRAEAILRPISQLMPSGVASASSNPVGGLSSALLGSTMSTGRSQEITTIMQSFDFSLAMVQRHHLQDELLSEAGGWKGDSDPQWTVFRLLQDRFLADFSLRTGNVTLTYLAPSRAIAQQILGYYIDDLREMLRDEQIRNTGAAIKSLKEEAKSTPDSLLEAQLYQMVAEQMQQQKTAMVEADFAFKVLQSPAASDRPYAPKPALVASMAGIVVLFMSCLALLTRDWLRRLRLAYERDTATSAPRRRDPGTTR